MSLMVNELNSFAAFVGNNADGRSVEVSKSGEVVLATKTASAFSRFFNTAGSRAAIAVNNNARESFVNALKIQFNVASFAELPASIKAALVGSHAKSAEEDFGFDAEGRVKSGKPLTARRISAVLNAVNEYNNQMKTAAATARVSPQIVEARMAALQPHMENLFNKITQRQEGYEMPLYAEKFHNMIRTTLFRSNIMSMIANIGNGKSYEVVRSRLVNIIGSGMGIVDGYWNKVVKLDDGRLTAGSVGRERLATKIINELINEFNAANPDLAIR